LESVTLEVNQGF